MEELPEYLKTLYPNATEEQILYYIKLIEDCSSDCLPPTSEMLEYVEVKKKIKHLEEQESSLRAKIIEQKKRLGVNFQLLKVTKTISHYFNDDGFYEFVSGLVSKRVLNSITIRTIDKKKFQELESQGKIRYDMLPEDLYKAVESYRITTPRSK